LIGRSGNVINLRHFCQEKRHTWDTLGN